MTAFDMTPKYKDFLLQELPSKLSTLLGNQEPDFGLMTAQHMVEHLVYVTKSLSKRRGEPGAELTKSQQYFKSFLDKGGPFEYRPKEGQSKADLNDLRLPNIEAAIDVLKTATSDFYNLFESNPDHKSYNDIMGEFDLAELELFNYQHGRWHLHQFGLVQDFGPVEV